LHGYDRSNTDKTVEEACSFGPKTIPQR
jgi:hypothetical protein